MVSGVGQIHVSVADVERSVAFYRDVLGLRHLFTVEGRPMAFFDVDGVRLYLAVSDPDGTPVGLMEERPDSGG